MYTVNKYINNNIIVRYFMNDTPHISMIHSTVNHIWTSRGKVLKIDVQFIGKKIVLFQVEDAQLRDRILKQKFWHISEVPLVLKRVKTRVCVISSESLSDAAVGGSGECSWLSVFEERAKLLARTTGKFVKLHPYTERCVRLGVARMLVEFDLHKPLPQKICFKGCHGQDSTVLVHYPWLPPCCNVCHKWGHIDKECRVEKPMVILKRSQEGKQMRDVTPSVKEVGECSGKQVVSQLLEKLERLPVDASLSEVTPNATAKDMTLFLNNLSSLEEVVSPNGFQMLESIHEEGKL